MGHTGEIESKRWVWFWITERRRSERGTRLCLRTGWADEKKRGKVLAGYGWARCFGLSCARQCNQTGSGSSVPLLSLRLADGNVPRSRRQVSAKYRFALILRGLVLAQFQTVVIRGPIHWPLDAAGRLSVAQQPGVIGQYCALRGRSDKAIDATCHLQSLVSHYLMQHTSRFRAAGRRDSRASPMYIPGTGLRIELFSLAQPMTPPHRFVPSHNCAVSRYDTRGRCHASGEMRHLMGEWLWACHFLR